MRSQRPQIIRSRDQMVVVRDEARAANVAKSQFLANVSHELRTPLNAIIGYRDLLLEEMGEDDFAPAQSMTDVTRIRSSGDYLLTLVNNILDISKMESGEMSLNWGEAHVPTLVDDMCGMIERLIAKKGNRFDYVCHGLGESVYLDVSKFRQILLNLISNANKFTSHGQIDVSIGLLDAEGDAPSRLLLQVADTGIGIAAEVIGRKL